MYKSELVLSELKPTSAIGAMCKDDTSTSLYSTWIKDTLDELWKNPLKCSPTRFFVKI
jgi:hypothetical protein